MILRRTNYMLQLLKTLRSAQPRPADTTPKNTQVVDIPGMPQAGTPEKRIGLRDLPWMTVNGSKLWLRGPQQGFGVMRADLLAKESMTISGSVWLFLPRRPAKTLKIDGPGTLWLWWWEGGLCLRILRADTSEVSRAAAAPRRYALLIGVSHYDTEDSLPWVPPGIAQLTAELEAHGYQVDRLLNNSREPEKGTRKPSICAKLADLKNVAADADILWVHYSGHGAYKNGLHLWAEEETFSKELVLVSMRESGAKKLLLTLDACNSGASADPSLLTDEQPERRDQQPYSCIAGCTRQQKAWAEDDERQRSVFSGAIVDALRQSDAAPIKWVARRRRVLTVGSMFDFVTQRLAQWSATRGINGQQTPTIEPNDFHDSHIADL